MTCNFGVINKKIFPGIIKPIRHAYAIMYSRLLQIAEVKWTPWSDIFGKGKKKEVNHEAEVAELHRQIGKLKVENNFLANLPGLNLAGRRNSR